MSDKTEVTTEAPDTVAAAQPKKVKLKTSAMIASRPSGTRWSSWRRRGRRSSG